MNVFKECIHADLRDKAAMFLGIEFESETKPHSKARPSPFITMTVLQLSVLSQYAGLLADAGEREAAVEMLLEVKNQTLTHGCNKNGLSMGRRSVATKF